jgi:outer membrane protein assembly factor BamB
MFRLDPLHTGRSGYRLPRSPSIVAHVATGGRISAQPSLSSDGLLVFGSHDGVVYAAHPDDGRVAWRFNTGDRVYGSPFVSAAGSIYVGSDADRLFELTSSGHLDVALATRDDADTSVAPAPDGSLRFASGRDLYALDPDLTVRWRLEFGGKVFSSPAVLADGTTIVGSQDDTVTAVAPDGAVRWRFTTGDDVDATPASDGNGTIFVGSDDGSVYGLAVADGAVRWRHAVGGFVRAGAALGLDGNVVVGTYGPHPRIVALSRETGDERWSVAITGPPTAEFGIASAALVDADGRYAIGTPDDAVYLLARDGHVDARIAMPADVDTPPILIADGTLVVGCDDGDVYVLR